MKIDKNIPLPKTKVDFVKELEIGDSILFKSRGEASSFSSIMSKNGVKPKMIKVEDGYRVWRIA